MAEDYAALLERIAALEAQVAALASLGEAAQAGQRASRQLGMLMQEPAIAGLLVGNLRVKQANIAAGAIGQVQIADGAVTAEKINVSNLGAISANLGTVQTGLLRTAASGARLEIDSTGLKLYDAGGVQRGHLRNDGSGWLGTQGGFSWDTAGNLSIDGGRLQTGSVQGTAIANAAITTAKIADAAVTSAKVAAAAIGTAHIQDASITNAKIVSVSADKITAGTISSQVVVSGEITTALVGSRVRLSGATYGGIIGYGSGDTYDPVTGSGTYQLLWEKATGKLKAGGGSVLIDSTGITVGGSQGIRLGTTVEMIASGIQLLGAGTALRWLEGGTSRFQVAVSYGPGTPFLDLRSINYSQDSRLILYAPTTGNDSRARLQAGGVFAEVRGNTYGIWVLRDDGHMRRIGIDTQDQLYVSAT